MNAALVVICLAMAQAGGQVRSGHASMVTLAASDGVDLEQADSRVRRLLQSGELRRIRVDEDTQLPGRQHERLQQYHKGVPVWGIEVVRQVAGGRAVSIFGTFYDGLDLDVTPKLTAREAEAAARKAAGAGALQPEAPELIVYMTPDPTGSSTPGTSGSSQSAQAALAYRVRVRHRGDITVFFVDARTGRIIDRYSDIRTTRPR